jgi:hypothetical protein
MNSVFSTFFGQKAEDNCLSYSLIGRTFKFYSGKDDTPLIGEAQLRQQDLSNTGSALKAKPLIYFWVPPEQQVFSVPEWGASTRMTVASFQPKQFFKGQYKTLDGKVSRSISLEVSNSGNIDKISGVLNGEIYVDLASGF